jgi:hypothetical protein
MGAIESDLKTAASMDVKLGYHQLESQKKALAAASLTARKAYEAFSGLMPCTEEGLRDQIQALTHARSISYTQHPLSAKGRSQLSANLQHQQITGISKAAQQQISKTTNQHKSAA